MSTERDLGQIDARLTAQEQRLDRIETKVDQLVEYMIAAKGGFRMLAAVGSIAAAVGAAISKLLEWKMS